MEILFTPDQKALVREGIENGRFRSEQDALTEALALWEERERVRAEILASVQTAEESLARGEGQLITHESMSNFANQIKQRGRARLAAMQAKRT